jgi:hypothetical protein
MLKRENSYFEMVFDALLEKIRRIDARTPTLGDKLLSMPKERGNKIFSNKAMLKE